MEKHLQITNNQWRLAATLHYPTNQEAEGSELRLHPAVIICHGFVGNRIGTDRLFVKTARALAARGFLVLRFDYAGCGESEGNYGQESIRTMIEQTRLVLDYVVDIDGIDRERITLIGHSLGGAVALLTAGKDQRVTDLVLWAPVAHPLTDILSIVGKDVYEQAEKDGKADYLGYAFSKSFFSALGDYHPFKEAPAFTGDVLIIHGTADATIPVDYAFLYQKVFWTRPTGRCEKEIIMQADHTFSSSVAYEIAVSRTAAWLLELKQKRNDWYGWTI